LNPQLRALLEAFDVPGPSAGRVVITLEALAGRMPRELSCDPIELRTLAESLVASGWLRRTTLPVEGIAPEPAQSAAPSNAPGGKASERIAYEGTPAYERTEDGRLALADPLDVTMYTRPGCHLCEEAKARIAPLLRRAGATLHEINIDADAVLRERYDFDVPVILLRTRKVAKHRVDVEQFSRQLEEARRDIKEGLARN
jgi:glutaredoxin